MLRTTSFIKIWLIVAGVFIFNGAFCQEKVTTGHPKNVVLLIGDGMGLAQVYAAQWASKEPLNILKAKHMGMMTTFSANNEVTDSGAGGTAIATGFKTKNGMIGMKPDSTAVPSMLDIFGNLGLSTGVVVSCAVTHATPASFVAKDINRNNFEAIALDYLDSPVNVVVGGGLKHFNKRKDGRLLTNEIGSKGIAVLPTIPTTDFAKYNNVYVLTDSVHPPRMSEGRGDHLPNGSRFALEVLNKNNKGFFLMIEGSQIDWAGHANDSSYLLAEMRDFDKTVGEVLAFAEKNPETLVIVTADHETGGLTFPQGALKGSIRFAYSTGDHTGIMVPVYAFGPGAEAFTGFYDNTNIIRKIMSVYGYRFE